VLTEKSELSLHDEDVAWSLRFLEILTWKQSSTISRGKKCGVMKLFAADFLQKVHVDRDQGHFNNFVISMFCVAASATRGKPSTIEQQ